jgi:hypothetical protein
MGPSGPGSERDRGVLRRHKRRLRDSLSNRQAGGDNCSREKGRPGEVSQHSQVFPGEETKGPFIRKIRRSQRLFSLILSRCEERRLSGRQNRLMGDLTY